MTEEDRIAYIKEIIKLNRQLGEALGTLQAVLYWDVPQKLKENIEDVVHSILIEDK